MGAALSKIENGLEKWRDRGAPHRRLGGRG